MRTRTLSGMTLIEVMVAIAVMVIAMQGFTYLFIKGWETNKFTLETGLASAAASRATNQIVKELRGVRQADNGDYPIESGDDFDLAVYVDIDDDGVVERIHYFLDDANDQLKVGIANPTGATPVSYPASDDEVRVMANYIVNESDEPIFYYYNRDYPGDTTNNPLSTPLSPGSVQLVRVHLRVNIDPVRAPNNINIESFVDLRNLEIYAD